MKSITVGKIKKRSIKLKTAFNWTILFKRSMKNIKNMKEDF